MAYSYRENKDALARKELNDLGEQLPSKQFNLTPGSQQDELLRRQLGFTPQEPSVWAQKSVAQRHAIAKPEEANVGRAQGLGPARSRDLKGALLGGAGSTVGADPNVGLANEQSRTVPENRMNQQAGGEATTEARGTRGTPPLPAGGFAWRSMKTGSSFEAPGGRLTPGQVKSPVLNDMGVTYSGEAAKSSGERGAFSVTRGGLTADEYNAKADALKAARLERQSMRPQRGGYDAGGVTPYQRRKMLENYKKELSGILSDSKSQKLTARGTANAIDALKNYYTEALGLSPQGEEAGKNYREELGAATDLAQSKITADAYTARQGTGTLKPDWDVEYDDYGNAMMFNKTAPNAMPRLIPGYSAIEAKLDTMPEGPAKEQLIQQLRAQGYMI